MDDPRQARRSARIGVRVALLTLVLVSGGGAPLWAYQQEVRSVAAQMADGLTKATRKRVAVVDFTDLQGNASELGRFLAEEVSVALALAAPSLEVIDRTHLKAIVQEHKLSATGLIDPLTARKLGQIAGVEALVTGTITPFGDSVRLSAKLLDATTARLLAASSVDIPKTKTTDELIARGVGSSGPGTPSPTPAPRQPGTVSTRVGSFEIGIRKCTKEGADVTCFGFITNRSAERRTFWFNGGESFRGPWLESVAIDNHGDQAAQVSLFFGPGGRHTSQDLEPEVPVNFWLKMTLTDQSNSVTIIISCSIVEAGTWMKVALRSIPIESR